jgi:hypothetical protein
VSQQYLGSEVKGKNGGDLKGIGIFFQTSESVGSITAFVDTHDLK